MARSLSHRLMFSGLLAAIVLGIASAVGASAIGGNEATERLRRRLEAPEGSRALAVGDEMLLCTESLKRFYHNRGYTLAWSNGREPDPQADSLLAILRSADREGLEPRDYHTPSAQALRARVAAGRFQRARSEAALVDFDLLLSDAFLLFGTHCLSGHLDPESIDPEWTANRRGGDLPGILERALNGDGVAAALRGLLPPQPGYARLRSLLKKLRALRDEGGWSLVPYGNSLASGDSGPRVAALSMRLSDPVAGKAGDDEANAVFDETLTARVRQFQRRHGLDVDGVVGPATLSALNVPVEDRIAQVMVNLERWRWLPQDLGRQHVLVNIADQRLQVFVGESPTLESAVIVGRDQRRTPVFSSRISYLVFRPYWDVPPTLAVQDKLPELRADPGRMAALGYQVFRGWGENEQEIDLLAVDWNRVSPNAFPYRLRQKPGPQNALGGVKFMFPNKYSVYLHDTPARELFGRSNRTFSSGCIRVERAADLARLLLADQPQWSADAIETAMTTGHDQTVRLKGSWPVHLEYWTAWVEPDGTVHFRSDIYGRDARVIAALRQPPPSSP